ncbi:MAG: ATP-grasp domain-containing protein [Chitinophagales bacterium]
MTFEIENVNIEALKQLQKEGLSIFPKPESLELIKDKGLQKLFYQENGQPTAAFQLYDSKAAILKAIQQKEILFPFVQKLRTGGYDGRGVAIIRSEDKLENLLDGPSRLKLMLILRRKLPL